MANGSLFPKKKILVLQSCQIENNIFFPSGQMWSNQNRFENIPLKNFLISKQCKLTESGKQARFLSFQWKFAFSHSDEKAKVWF